MMKMHSSIFLSHPLFENLDLTLLFSLLWKIFSTPLMVMALILRRTFISNVKRTGYPVKEMPVTWSYKPDSKLNPFKDTLKMGKVFANYG
jgi:hypothetical protein